MKIECKNCNTNFEGNFCNNCGQSADTDTINAKTLWKDTVSLIFKYYEKGIIYSVKQLFTRPGHTIREYIEGKRVNHFKPFSLLVMFAALYGLIYSTFNINFFAEISNSTSLGASNLLKINRWLSSNYSLTIFLTLPVITLGSFFSFRKLKYNFAEHLILNTYLASQRMIYRVATFPLLLIANGTHHLNLITDLYLIADFGLMLWAYLQFFEKLKKKDIILLTISSYLIMNLGILAVSLLVVIIFLS